MENLDDNLESTHKSDGDYISPQAKSYLTRSSGWVLTLAIIGIIGTSIGIISGFIFIFSLNVVLGIVYILIYAFGLYMSILMIKMAKYLKQETFALQEFAENHYNYWKLVVIYIIVAFALALIGGFFFISTTSSVQF